MKCLCKWEQCGVQKSHIITPNKVFVRIYASRVSEKHKEIVKKFCLGRKKIDIWEKSFYIMVRQTRI